MSVTIQQVIDRARDQHPAFSEQTTAPKPLVRYLDGVREDLIADAVAIYPDPLLDCTEKIGLPLSEFDRGEPFPAHFFARGDRVVYSATQWRPLKLVPYPQRGNFWPAASLRGGRVYLSGSEKDWGRVDHVTIDYVGQPAPLAEKDAPLSEEIAPLPDYARNALVAATARWMAHRTDGVDPRGFETDMEVAAERFLKTLTNERRAAPLQITG